MTEPAITELEQWLPFVHCHGIGPRTIHQLLNGFDSPEAILRASDSKLTSAGLSQKKVTALRNTDQSGINRDIEWYKASEDRHIITYSCASYPPLLKQIADPPLVLYVRGDLEVLSTPQLAIVGSRKPSRSAAVHATEMAAQLCAYGLTICSGLAIGVDACAHRGALQAEGLTVAVTATGLDRVYPAAHQSLAREIVQTGAIVSEFPIGTSPKPAYFPRRNRIISGLCYGTLVVEAALKSGTLTTAAHATEQSREVFAIPGSIDNPQSRGCHALLRNGATLVESIEDILIQLAPLLPTELPTALPTALPTSTEFEKTNDANRVHGGNVTGTATNEQPQPPIIENPHSKPQPELEKKKADEGPSLKPENYRNTSDMQKVLNAFDYTPLPLDAIVDATGLDIVTITNLAFDLELSGAIAAVAGGKYVKTKQ